MLEVSDGFIQLARGVPPPRAFFIYMDIMYAAGAGSAGAAFQIWLFLSSNNPLKTHLCPEGQEAQKGRLNSSTTPDQYNQLLILKDAAGAKSSAL